jgi:hypothetical protein
MSTIPFLLLPLLEYLVPTGLGLGVLYWVFRKRLTRVVIVAWLGAIALWVAIAFTSGRGSLSNLVLEPLMLAAGMLLLFALHLAVDEHRIIWGRLLVSASLLLAVCIAFFTPVLPE